jgi:catalase
MNFQQDGHMAMRNPKGRVNYEPNSWGGAAGGPRESQETGYRSYPAHEDGDKLRVRSETFADHYSQARQFYISQTRTEQGHIADAFIFELSKVDSTEIRSRMVSHLLNVDKELAQKVAAGLGMSEMPKASTPAKAPITNLKSSKALSMLENGPKSFKGRKVGALLTDGFDQTIFEGLKQALTAEGAMLEIIAPAVGGVKSNAGKTIAANQKIGGGPSVLYDAVVVLASQQGALLLAKNPVARQFVTDAFTHLKFIGYTEPTKLLFEKAGLLSDLDDGCIPLDDAKSVTTFLGKCRVVRHWMREALVKVSTSL